MAIARVLHGSSLIFPLFCEPTMCGVHLMLPVSPVPLSSCPLQSAIQVVSSDLGGCFVESSVPAELTREGTHNTGPTESQYKWGADGQHTQTL